MRSTPGQYSDDHSVEPAPHPRSSEAPRQASLLSRLRSGPLSLLLATTAPIAGCFGIDRPGMSAQTVFDGVEPGGQVDLYDDETVPQKVYFDRGERWGRREIINHFKSRSDIDHLSSVLLKLGLTICSDFSGAAYYDGFKVPVFTIDTDCLDGLSDSEKPEDLNHLMLATYLPEINTIFLFRQDVEGALAAMNQLVPSSKDPLTYADVENTTVLHELAHQFFDRLFGDLQGSPLESNFRQLSKGLPENFPFFIAFSEMHAYGVELLGAGEYKKEYLKSLVCLQCTESTNPSVLMYIYVLASLQAKIDAAGYKVKTIEDVYRFIDERMTDQEVDDLAEAMINKSVELVQSAR